jgi:hypothetical protein
MKILVLVAVGLTLCLPGASFAQAPGGHKATAQIVARPSPAELRRRMTFWDRPAPALADRECNSDRRL